MPRSPLSERLLLLLLAGAFFLARHFPLLLSLGLASITFLLLVGHQLHKAFERDLAGIDVVVGAKGSPMQLILSGVLHVDVPPGNVPLAVLSQVVDEWVAGQQK